MSSSTATKMEAVKMSAKGQLVVPQSIRKQIGLNPGERFVAFPIADGVVFKKVRISDIHLEFKQLSEAVQKRFKAKGITEVDLEQAVEWARKR